MYRPRGGLGDQQACVRVFDDLRPYAEQLAEWRADFPITSPDWMAVGIAWDGLQTTAYHFTRRRYFYAEAEESRPQRLGANNRLNDRHEAIAAFEDLTPFVDRFRRLMESCPPFGRDWLALKISVESLETTAMHFTKLADFYGANGDSTDANRPAY